MLIGLAPCLAERLLSGHPSAMEETADLFAKKKSHALYAIMAKTYFADCSKVLHWPAALGGCDFGNCYDRAAHVPAALALRAWGIPKHACRLLFTALQTMQYCLRTGFGESSRLYGGTADNPIAGYGQGNGMAPPGFTALSTLVIKAYRRKGHGAHLTSAYTSRLFLLAAVMYVDDTDLTHWGKSQEMSDAVLVRHVQDSTTDYGELAQATGGILKQEKCFTYFLTYRFVNGIARLQHRKHLPPAPMTLPQAEGPPVPAHINIPQPSGGPLPVPTLEIDEHRETLGFWYAPNGDGTVHMEKWRTRAIGGWTNSARNPFRHTTHG